MTDVTVTGTELNYYYLCKRKLWLFSRGITMEHTSDNVFIGKLVDEHAYSREKKGILIDGKVMIDYVNDGVVHEVKKSNRMEQAHIGQVLYYIYCLRRKGMDIRQGVINYPKQKRRTEVVLTSEKEAEIEEAISRIGQVKALAQPPGLLSSKVCRKCSYEDFCYS